ncbi:MAG TPA: DinB family protein [Actinomycetota bacterium]|jgi:hypothetical protein
MAQKEGKVRVYLEIGSKRVFAGALEWPGWCRSGKDEGSALGSLLEYVPRYAKVLRRTKLGFTSPRDGSAFKVVERLEGDATTDFGAPGRTPKFDQEPVDARELARSQDLLEACWKAFDSAVDAASGKELRKGPRGGGRDIDKIVQHVLEAEAGYLARIGTKHKVDEKAARDDEFARVRETMLEALSSAAGSEPVRKGPRGGTRWTPRYCVRRSAWHVLDHAWEIEDRAINR